MGYIYKITNDINNKVYIGLTTLTLTERFQKHYYASEAYKINPKTHQPLYNAINKYGFEHFKIELVEECADEILNEKEKYWISKYDSYNNGYNGTLGGEGVTHYNYKEIYDTLITNEQLTCKQIAEKFNCCLQTVCNIAHKYGIDLNKRMSLQKKGKSKINYKSKESLNKIVNQYDLNGNFIQSFSSIREASRWLEQTKNVKFDSAKAAISRACNHPEKSKTAYKFIWKFI